jgi:ABC-type cobalamin/Fe3+-siderophores transport system ATPase subunit
MTTTGTFKTPVETRSGAETYVPMLHETTTQPVSLTKAPETLSIRTASSHENLEQRPLANMIESLSVSNFRGFDSLEIHGLKRINVLVGQNASGKTALLEAIFLASGGSPELALRVQAQRGLSQIFQLTVDRGSYESLWKYLFHLVDQSKTISINLIGTPSNTRSLTIAYVDQESAVLPFGKGDVGSPFIVPIKFVWRDHKGEVTEAQPTITKEGLNVGGTGEILPVFLFSSSTTMNAAENASRFSELDLQGKSGIVVEALKREFPYIRGISIQVVSGVPTLHAAVSFSDLKIPLGLLSGGISKLTGILLAVALKPHGIVLIDEIENGLHYDHLRTIWSSLLSICKEQNTQIFASTHSQECLNAALETIRGNEDDFALIRTERVDGRCKAQAFGGRQFQSAIEQNIEVR